jgi:putative glutamine amidotransferase
MARHVRPLIGITTDFVAASKRGPAQAMLQAGYFDSVSAAGGLPLLVPPLGKNADVDALLDRLAGLVFSGGADLDPRKQGLPPHSAVVPMAERREASDRALMRRAIERRKPILAIGVGMQLLNVLHGGTLYMHLPTDLPRALPHLDASEPLHRHAVILQNGTRLEEIFGGMEVLVNSAHHQAVRQVGAGLRVGAKSPDGVIEAIEAEDAHWFCLGLQWHPESASASALDLQIFECLVQACLRDPAMNLAA